MNSPEIIGILLVKDEDRFIEPVIKNIFEFCDKIIVADNYSRDQTYTIAREFAEKNSKLKVYQVSHPRESHKLIEHYAGTNTWIFGVDGDEIYDPSGLAEMKAHLNREEFKNIWCIYGNVLNCTSIDVAEGFAKGYLAPPSRSMTKLYNFSLLESWTGCPERLHSGALRFKISHVEPPRLHLYKTLDWDTSYFRCLHAVFMQRSSLKRSLAKRGRLNPAELHSIWSAYDKKSYVKFMLRYLRSWLGPDWKHKKYRRGPLVQKHVDSFF